MNQLNLFTTKVCSHCGNGGISPRNPSLWDGFQDHDTGELVCWRCRHKHYVQKAKELGGWRRMTYSEFPVML